jgi:hypothetical protein
VDWRDSPKEDKQKFTKMCEVRRKKKLMIDRMNWFLIRFYLQLLKKKQKLLVVNVFFLLLL